MPPLEVETRMAIASVLALLVVGLFTLYSNTLDGMQSIKTGISLPQFQRSLLPPLSGR
jgi:hypothetical protein